MILRITLEKAIGGYWDGGNKQVFNFDISPFEHSDKNGVFVRVGSWEANSWFHVSKGKTERLTFSHAIKHLRPLLERDGIRFTYEYITE
jgi:hypothetical protein